MTQTHDPNAAAPPAPDPVLERLSALHDGELAGEEARFLLRRLESDPALAERLSRWQLAGDVLRGQAMAPAPAGFAGRVAAALAADGGTDRNAGEAGGRGPAWRRPARWGSGLALAASVAVVALFVARQSPDAGSGAPREAVASQATAPAAPPALATTGHGTPAAPDQGGGDPQAPAAPDAAAALSAVAAAASLPRRVADARSRGQSQRAARRAASRRDAVPQRAIAGQDATRLATAASPAGTGNPDGAGPGAASPFAVQGDTIVTRPWPRALLPGGSPGAFNVDYAGPGAPGYRPFQPLLRSVGGFEAASGTALPLAPAPADLPGAAADAGQPAQQDPGAE